MHDFPYFEVFVALANVESFAVARYLTCAEINQLEDSINIFSKLYRQNDLPLINKLHELESHVVTFVKRFKSWGLYSEQGENIILNYLKIFSSGIEAIHKLGNLADNRSKGKNIPKSLPIFIMRQLRLTFSVNLSIVT